ncbi:hypothetical protein C0J52_03295 [Blattella germanica]|nr:hypothetical protein C0J52_03295 [Blattella germanica]
MWYDVDGGGGGCHGDGDGDEDDMMETENESLRERVADLEKKVLEQGDEIVCLRSTLADVLRRLNQFETRGSGNIGFSSVPLRNGNGTNPRSVPQSNHLGPGKDSPSNAVRLRQPAYHQQSDGTPKETARRTASYAPSSLPQRRVVHYQSTGSLHSDSPSSTSVSPVPTSPSPTHTPPPPPPGGRTTPSPRTPQPPQQRPSSVGSSTGSLHKRWSSTGDFNNSGITSPTGTLIGSNSMAVASSYCQPHRASFEYHLILANANILKLRKVVHSTILRLATKSLFNLYMRPQQHQQHLLKHGTRDATYNEEEGSVRFFLRGRPIVLHAPTAVAETYDIMKVATAPQSRLKLEWVYGYRGRDCRSNLHLLPTGEMVYFVAAAVVLYNVEEQSQRHYLGHTDDVKCLSVHPNKLLVATGQAAGHDRREGRSWKFNPPPDRTAPEAEQWDGGALLCAIDEAPDHNISIWDWQRGERGQKITETKCSADTVVAAEFHPMDRQSIVTCGKSHISFWTLDAGGTLYKRMGIFENRDKPKYVTCLAFTQSGDTVSGDSNGNVIIWGRDELWGLAIHPNLPQFLSAGHDRLVSMWDSMSHSVVWTKDVGVARFSPDGNLLALGSRDNNIYVYQVNEDARKYSRVGRCTGHSSFITHLDWSTDSQYIQSNSGDYELLYCLLTVDRGVSSKRFGYFCSSITNVSFLYGNSRLISQQLMKWEKPPWTTANRPR